MLGPRLGLLALAACSFPGRLLGRLAGLRLGQGLARGEQLGDRPPLGDMRTLLAPGRGRLAEPSGEFGSQREIPLLGEKPRQIGVLVRGGERLDPPCHLGPGGRGGGLVGAAGRGHFDQVVIDPQELGQCPQRCRQLRQAGRDRGLALVVLKSSSAYSPSQPRAGNEASQPR